MNDRRVVITGLGTVNALGHNVEAFWSALIAGRSGIRTVSHFDASDLPCKVASEVIGFDPSPYMDAKEINRTDPYATVQRNYSTVRFSQQLMKCLIFLKNTDILSFSAPPSMLE